MSWLKRLIKFIDAVLDVIAPETRPQEPPDDGSGSDLPVVPITPIKPPPCVPLPPPPVLDRGLADVYNQLLISHNNRRVAVDAPKLHEVVTISEIAQRHADYLATKDRFGELHARPPGRSLDSDFRDTGWRYTVYGENAAAGQRTVVDVMSAWYNSTGHRRNMLDPRFRHVGFGYAVSKTGRPFWVTMLCN